MAFTSMFSIHIIELQGISSPTWLPYTLQWASTRHIQCQCDCHIHFNELLRGISSSTWLRQPFNELLRGISSPRPTQIWSANPSLSLYEVYARPTWLPYRSADLQYIHEIYPGPTWLRQPFNELLQDLSKANVTTINDMETFNTYTRYIQDQRDCAKPWMSFYETYPGPIRQHSMTSTRHTSLSPTIRQHSMSFYETYPSPAWLPYTICRPSIHTRGISRTNVTRPT